MKHFQPYDARNGRTQYRPAAGWLEMAINSGRDTGFCLACAEDTEGIEPDAGACLCPQCGEPKLYGAEDLLIRGIFFDDDRETDIQNARRAGFIR
jgi:hypothetical protein